MNIEVMETQRVEVVGRLWSGVCACSFIADSMRHFADEPGELEELDRRRALRGLSAMVGYVGKDLETVHETVCNWE